MLEEMGGFVPFTSLYSTFILLAYSLVSISMIFESGDKDGENRTQ